MRWLAALPALLLVAVPAAAQDKPAWVGVWAGKVGTYPVRLCIDVVGDAPARGAYYYLSQLEPIAITERDGEGGWVEQGSEDPDALWSFSEQTGERLRGTWTRGNRSLPFELTTVAWTEGEWGGPCSSLEFMEPRFDADIGEIVSERALLGSWAYTKHVYRPPPHFAEEVTIESFGYPAQQPGDAEINTILTAGHLPRGLDAHFLECIGGAISSVGADGFFEEKLAPTMISRDFLTVEESSGTYCGGAHPSYYVVDHTFDRQSGEELDLFDWIGAPSSADEVSLISEPLRALAVARWPADAEEECRQLAEETEYWSLGLAEEGLIFRPDFPQVATACEEPVTVEWQALAPFLDAEGRAGLARLRGG